MKPSSGRSSSGAREKEKLFPSGEEDSALSPPDILETAAVLCPQNAQCTQDSTGEGPVNT